MDALVADIQANGQHEPIVVTNGEILDGRHRFEACRMLGLEPKIIERNDLSDEQARTLVISANLVRRQMTLGQRALVALRLRNGSASLQSRLSNKQAAQIAGISERLLQTLIATLKRDPNLEARIESGELSINGANTVAELPEQQRAEVVQSLGAASSKGAKKKLIRAAKAASSVSSGMRKSQPGPEFPTPYLELLRELQALPDLLEAVPLNPAQMEKLIQALIHARSEVELAAHSRNGEAGETFDEH